MHFQIFLLILASAIAFTTSATIEKRDCNSCNSCGNNNCNSCSTPSCSSCNSCSSCSNTCNTCISQCNNDCRSESCRNNCVQGCSATCQQSSNCDVSSCSSCINNCSKGCSSSQCVNSCSNSCSQCKEKVTEVVREGSDETIILGQPEPSQVIVNNSNVNHVNLTTHININNVVHNLNNISIPVYVNTTNINNINLSETREDHAVIPPWHGGSSNVTVIDRPSNPIVVPYPYPQPQPCCHVLHPRQCYTDTEGDRRCYIRRTQECSSSCTSPVVTIEEGGDSRSCQTVNSWPYAYCGNYVRRDCDQCYNCGSNSGQCFRQSGCSDSCRAAAPNCVPSQGGLQCY